MKYSEETMMAEPREQHARHRHRRRGWQVAAFVVCPCHLPIILAIAGGSTLGAAFSRNGSLLFAGLAVAFMVAIWRGFLTEDRSESCAACESGRE